MRRVPRGALTLTVVSAVILGACGTDEPDLACEPVSAELLSEMQAAMNIPVSLDDAVAVRSPDHEKIWYLAAHADGDGWVAEPALWATNIEPASRIPGGIVFSVNRFAIRNSDWPADDRMLEEDSAAQRALACLAE